MYGTLISTQTLATTAVSVTFSSIPQTYTDLVLVVSARGTNATTNIVCGLQFNGDTASNYTMRYLNGNGASAASSNGTFGYIYTGVIDAASATANTFGNMIVTIPNYAGSTTKVTSIDTIHEDNSSTAYQYLVADSWSGTAAINSITAIVTLGSFAAGSMFSLYGLTHF